MARPAGLVLADHSSWCLSATNIEAEPVVGWLARVLSLESAPPAGTRKLQLSVEPMQNSTIQWAIQGQGQLRAEFGLPENLDQRIDVYQRLLMPVYRDVERSGGVLLHGGLVGHEGRGFVLAGPGHVGKSTACQRLPKPWQSLSDDLTLVVREPGGGFRAHPWPTWSRFLFNGPGGAWKVQQSLPLAGIFVLQQAKRIRRQALDGAHATCLLMELSEQAWRGLEKGLAAVEIRALRLSRLASLIRLVSHVPCSLLQLNLTDSFWNLLRP